MDVLHLGKQALSPILVGELPDPELISLFISKLLGVAILAGACIVKLPQLYTVWKAKSGEGMPLVSSELENYVYLIHLSYGIIMGLPFTAYGEAIASWVQNAVLLLLLYKFKRSSIVRPILSGLVVAAVLTPVYKGLISQENIARLYNANSTIFIISKLPQVISAFREGKTGQASFFTNFLQLAGSMARIFTSIKEGAGLPMIRGFFMGTFINGLVTCQILFYGKDGRKQAEASTSEKKDK